MDDWEAPAAARLLELLPELSQYPIMRRHPVVMAFIARHVLNGTVRRCPPWLPTIRSELGALVPANVTAAVLGELRAAGQRLSGALRAVELVEVHFVTVNACPIGALWVPTISSRSRDQAIFVDDTARASAPSYPVLLENDRWG